MDSPGLLPPFYLFLCALTQGVGGGKRLRITISVENFKSGFHVNSNSKHDSHYIGGDRVAVLCLASIE
jgi:hypothetical protein